MRCNKCGFDNPENARICQNCDEPLLLQPGNPGSPNRSAPRPAPPSTQASKSSVPRPAYSPPPPPPQSVRASRPPAPGVNIASQTTQDRDRHDNVRGIVSGFQERPEPSGLHVWVFRIDIYDDAGNSVQRVPVEMRGYAFTGIIRDGDTVEVPGPWQQDRILKPDRVYHVDTGTYVGLTQSARVGRRVMPILIVFGIVGFLAIVGFVAYSMIRPPDNGYPTISVPQPCDTFVHQVDYQKDVVERLTVSVNNARDASERDFWDQQLRVQTDLLEQRQRDLEQCRSDNPRP